VFAYDPETKRQSSEWVVEISPQPKKQKFQKSRKKIVLINLFDSQRVVHKEFVPEEKTLNAEFYKAVMDRLLKHIQRVRPAGFCSRDVFLLHDNAPAHKVANVCQFFTPKMLQPFITPVMSRFISGRLFSVPQVANEVKGLHFADVAELQEAVTDKGPKEELSGAQMRVYMQMELILNNKSCVSSSCLFGY
jgi:histone-lysine N-methyltransferase SETMAR